MADRRPSRLRRGMHLFTTLLLAALLAYVLRLSLVSEEAHHNLEHGPEAQRQLDRALEQYYEQKNKK